MEKVCFLVCQYGKEVNGGAENHCRMLAERLVNTYEVDILTSRSINYNTFEPYYKEDTDQINGVNVLRFDCEPYNSALHQAWRKKAKYSRKIRRNLFRLGLLKTIADKKPKWNLGIKEEIGFFKSHGFYSPKTYEYLKAHQHEYKAIFIVTYLFPHAIFSFDIAPEKTILIPTLHNDSEAFRSMQTHLFTTVKHIAFNTIEETNLAYQIYGDQLSENSILAVGVETDFEQEVSLESLQNKFHIPSTYMHYFGRVCDSKMEKLIPWFINYKSKFPNDLKLVLTGRLFQKKIDHPDIMYTGFVSDEEKVALVKNATLVVNPSKLESLSLLLLEAMNLGKTVLVNAQSDVMKGHAIRSNHAAEYYLNEGDFYQKINKYMLQPTLLENNKIKAKTYVEENYNWEKIIGKLIKLIETL